MQEKDWKNKLTKPQIDIADAYFQEITNDPTKPIIVAADAILKHIPGNTGFNLTEEQRATTHAVAIAVWERIFTNEKMLKRIDQAYITAGPPGAGKSTLHQNLGPRCAFYDCTFSHKQKYEQQRMDAPLDAGIDLMISYTHRPPEISIPATMDRAHNAEHRCIGKLEHFDIPTKAIANVIWICDAGLVDFSDASSSSQSSPQKSGRGKLFFQAYNNVGTIDEAFKSRISGRDVLPFLQEQLRKHYSNRKLFGLHAEKITRDHAQKIGMKAEFLALCLEEGHPDPRADNSTALAKQPTHEQVTETPPTPEARIEGSNRWLGRNGRLAGGARKMLPCFTR